MPVLDTPAQATAHSALAGYAAAVTTNESKALHEMTEIQAARDAEQEHIAARDQLVGAMHLDDGLSAPDIARRLGMSISNVRAIVKRVQYAREHGG